MKSRDPELNSNWGTICTLVQKQTCLIFAEAMPFLYKDKKMKAIHNNRTCRNFRQVAVFDMSKKASKPTAT